MARDEHGPIIAGPPLEEGSVGQPYFPPARPLVAQRGGVAPTARAIPIPLRYSGNWTVFFEYPPGTPEGAKLPSPHSNGTFSNATKSDLQKAALSMLNVAVQAAGGYASKVEVQATSNGQIVASAGVA